MRKLIAARPILYLGRMYQVGDCLPGNDVRMVEAWVRNKSAAWDGETAQDPPQELEKVPEVSGDQGEAEGGQEAQEQHGEGEPGGMIAGHLDPKDLEDLKKADLERMATDMGLDISEAKTKADLIAAITAVEVYAPAEDKNGGAL